MSELGMTVKIRLPYIHILKPDGTLAKRDAALPSFVESAGIRLRLYEAMVQAREFDAKAVALAGSGQLGTYPSCEGQEAIGAGIGAAMQKRDGWFPQYRDPIVFFMRGVPMRKVFCLWGGIERGMCFDESQHDAPFCVPIGTHAPHAAGWSLAQKMRGVDAVAVCVFGDGGSSKGDVYEAFNFAGVLGLPVVFVIVNNGWAISVRTEKQSALQALVLKGINAGIFDLPRVDGNDVLATASVMQRLVEEAREKRAPRVVEMLTYRVGNHTTVEDARQYRPDEEVEEARAKDPILRMKRFLIASGEWDDERDEALRELWRKRVAEESEAYFNTPLEEAADMFSFLYEDMPSALGEQMEIAQREREAVVLKGEAQ